MLTVSRYTLTRPQTARKPNSQEHHGHVPGVIACHAGKTRGEFPDWRSAKMPITTMRGDEVAQRDFENGGDNHQRVGGQSGVLHGDRQKCHREVKAAQHHGGNQGAGRHVHNIKELQHRQVIGRQNITTVTVSRKAPPRTSSTPGKSGICSSSFAVAWMMFCMKENR